MTVQYMKLFLTENFNPFQESWAKRWSKLYSFLDTNFFTIITYKKAKEPELTDTDFMATTHSGHLSWLITIRYWKQVVVETGISASPNTIEIKNFIGTLFLQGEKRQNQPRTNQQTVHSYHFEEYSFSLISYSFKHTWVSLVQKKKNS